MLNSVDSIPYSDGINKYLPLQDVQRLKKSMDGWYYDGIAFVKVSIIGIIGDEIIARYKGTEVRLSTTRVFSDKTITEAVEKLATVESNKKLELVAQKTQGEYDTITKPKHYMLFPDKGIEVRDLVKMLINRANENGYNQPMFLSDQAQMLQYILRFDAKNGKEDLEKARWYLDKMIESL